VDSGVLAGRFSIKEFTEVEAKIGKNIADLVEDGSTIQLGIGGIPNAALSATYSSSRS